VVRPCDQTNRDEPHFWSRKGGGRGVAGSGKDELGASPTPSARLASPRGPDARADNSPATYSDLVKATVPATLPSHSDPCQKGSAVRRMPQLGCRVAGRHSGSGVALLIGRERRRWLRLDACLDCDTSVSTSRHETPAVDEKQKRPHSPRRRSLPAQSSRLQPHPRHVRLGRQGASVTPSPGTLALSGGCGRRQLPSHPFGRRPERDCAAPTPKVPPPRAKRQSTRLPTEQKVVSASRCPAAANALRAASGGPLRRAHRDGLAVGPSHPRGAQLVYNGTSLHGH
jgi:hypothetical protein